MSSLISPTLRQSGYRLAILQTDSVAAPAQPEHGNYPEMFVRLLAQAGFEEAAVDTVDVQQGPLPAPTAYQGYLITGSKCSVYDDEPWITELASFVGVAMAAGSKVIGICFGHQLLAHFFGGRVTKASNGWVVGLHENSMLAQLPWMQPYATKLSMLSSHQDQVQTLPDSATLIASTAHCPIAGFIIGDMALGLQSHPEYSAAYAAELMNSRAKILGSTILEEGLASLSGPLDNNVAAQWILNFLLSGAVETSYLEG